VDIRNAADTATLRSFTGLTSPTVTYTAADQTADGLTPGDPVRVRVHQVSAIVGRGRRGAAIVSSPNLAIAHVAAAQAQKEGTINSAVDLLDRAVTEVMTIDFGPGDVTLTAAQYRQHRVFRAAGPAVARTLTLPQIRREVAIDNAAGTATLTVARGTGFVEIPAGAALRDVISLRRLLDDIEAHAYLITRDVFVCYDGLPFDFDAAESAYWQREGLPASGEVVGLPVAGPDALDSSRRAHEAFDRASGTKAAVRSRFDRLGPEVFAELRKLLEAPEIAFIVQLRHKFVAHAADPISISKAGIERFGITLNQLEAAQKALVQAAQRIERDLLWGSSRGVVPVPQHDHFAHLDRPVVPAARLEELSAWWDEHCRSREAWTQSV
jgi:hypothetical protein